MSHRTQREASDDFLHRLRLALSCITRQGIVTNRFLDPAGVCVAAFRDDAVLQRPDAPYPGREHFLLRIAFNYRIVRAGRREWDVEVSQYFYVLLDGTGNELLAYHWHPVSESRVKTPHLHLGRGADVGCAELQPKVHLPTGFVALGEFLLFLIREMKVLPLRGDWERVLESTRAAGA